MKSKIDGLSIMFIITFLIFLISVMGMSYLLYFSILDTIDSMHELGRCRSQGYDTTIDQEIEPGYVKCCRNYYNMTHELNTYCDILKIEKGG